MQKLIGRKLGLFGHICRMHNNRKIIKGADVWKNGGHKQEGKTTQGMARQHHQVGRDFASETEPDGIEQRKLMKLASDTYRR